MHRSHKRDPESSKSGEHGEEKKTIIDSSFQLAFLRGLRHVFPVSICVLLISLNSKGVYIGPALEFGSWTTTYSLAAFQVAAKVQVCPSRDHVYLKELILCDRSF